jgi:hypothetical protein
VDWHSTSDESAETERSIVYIDAIGNANAYRNPGLTTVSEVLDFVEELADRFPDMLDGEILLSASEIRGEDIEYDSLLGHAVMTAYISDAETALNTWYAG